MIFIGIISGVGLFFSVYAIWLTLRLRGELIRDMETSNAIFKSHQMQLWELRAKEPKG